MNLYIINDVLYDYTPGMVCIVAKDLNQARDLYMEKFGSLDFDRAIENKRYQVLKVENETPRIVSYVYGGG